MSTRSIILVTGDKTGDGSGSQATVRIYKHWDGYPSGNLPVILNAIERAEKMDKDNRERFPGEDKPSRINVDQMTGLIIGESVSIYGTGARVDEDELEESPFKRTALYDKPFEPKHMGNQWDLEWVYVVNIPKKNVDVYGNGSYTSAEEHVKYQTVHPDTEVKDYKEECKAPALLELQEIYEDYRKVGWTIGGKDLSKKEIKVQTRKISWKEAVC
jgi:hypothetical protein